MFSLYLNLAVLALRFVRFLDTGMNAVGLPGPCILSFVDCQVTLPASSSSSSPPSFWSSPLPSFVAAPAPLFAEEIVFPPRDTITVFDTPFPQQYQQQQTVSSPPAFVDAFLPCKTSSTPESPRPGVFVPSPNDVPTVKTERTTSVRHPVAVPRGSYTAGTVAVYKPPKTEIHTGRKLARFLLAMVDRVVLLFSAIPRWVPWVAFVSAATALLISALVSSLVLYVNGRLDSQTFHSTGWAMLFKAQEQLGKAQKDVLNASLELNQLRPNTEALQAATLRVSSLENDVRDKEFKIGKLEQDLVAEEDKVFEREKTLWIFRQHRRWGARTPADLVQLVNQAADQKADLEEREERLGEEAKQLEEDKKWVGYPEHRLIARCQETMESVRGLERRLATKGAQHDESVRRSAKVEEDNEKLRNHVARLDNRVRTAETDMSRFRKEATMQTQFVVNEKRSNASLRAALSNEEARYRRTRDILQEVMDQTETQAKSSEAEVSQAQKETEKMAKEASKNLAKEKAKQTKLDEAWVENARLEAEVSDLKKALEDVRGKLKTCEARSAVTTENRDASTSTGDLQPAEESNSAGIASDLSAVQEPIDPVTSAGDRISENAEGQDHDPVPEVEVPAEFLAPRSPPHDGNLVEGDHETTVEVTPAEALALASQARILPPFLATASSFSFSAQVPVRELASPPPPPPPPPASVEQTSLFSPAAQSLLVSLLPASRPQPALIRPEELESEAAPSQGLQEEAAPAPPARQILPFRRRARRGQQPPSAGLALRSLSAVQHGAGNGSLGESSGEMAESLQQQALPGSVTTEPMESVVRHQASVLPVSTITVLTPQSSLMVVNAPSPEHQQHEDDTSSEERPDVESVATAEKQDANKDEDDSTWFQELFVDDSNMPDIDALEREARESAQIDPLAEGLSKLLLENSPSEPAEQYTMRIPGLTYPPSPPSQTVTMPDAPLTPEVQTTSDAPVVSILPQEMEGIRASTPEPPSTRPFRVFGFSTAATPAPTPAPAPAPAPSPSPVTVQPQQEQQQQPAVRKRSLSTTEEEPSARRSSSANQPRRTGTRTPSSQIERVFAAHQQQERQQQQRTTSTSSQSRQQQAPPPASPSSRAQPTPSVGSPSDNLPSYLRAMIGVDSFTQRSLLGTHVGIGSRSAVADRLHQDRAERTQRREEQVRRGEEAKGLAAVDSDAAPAHKRPVTKSTHMRAATPSTPAQSSTSGAQAPSSESSQSANPEAQTTPTPRKRPLTRRGGERDPRAVSQTATNAPSMATQPAPAQSPARSIPLVQSAPSPDPSDPLMPGDMLHTSNVAWQEARLALGLARRPPQPPSASPTAGRPSPSANTGPAGSSTAPAAEGTHRSPPFRLTGEMRRQFAPNAPPVPSPLRTYAVPEGSEGEESSEEE